MSDTTLVPKEAVAELELAVAITRPAAWLASQGVRAGDVIAFCAPDSIGCAMVRWAASSLGAIETTVDPEATAREIYRELCKSGARWLVTTGRLFAEKVEVAVRPSAVLVTFVFGAVPEWRPRPVPFDVF